MIKNPPLTLTHPNGFCIVMLLFVGITLYCFYAEFGLRGVDVCSEVSLTVTNKAQHFIWKKFGLKLTIPSGVLPPDIDQCDLLIKASLSGNYRLPRKYHLVSPIFWIRCSPHCKFAKVITVEIQHCALDQNISKLSFIKASCTQKELPYAFEVISGGKFSTASSYGLIELNSFSATGAAQRDTEEREYCSRLFYLKNHQVHFTVTWNTNGHRYVRRIEWCIMYCILCARFTQFSFRQ